MAELEEGTQIDIEQSLNALRQRNAEAEERLSRLEAAIETKNDAVKEEHLKVIRELELKLENSNTELLAERERAEKLATENAKLQYRIIHLVRTAREALQKLEQHGRLGLKLDELK